MGYTVQILKLSLGVGSCFRVSLPGTNGIGAWRIQGRSKEGYSVTMVSCTDCFSVCMMYWFSLVRGMVYREPLPPVLPSVARNALSLVAQKENHNVSEALLDASFFRNNCSYWYPMVYVKSLTHSRRREVRLLTTKRPTHRYLGSIHEPLLYPVHHSLALLTARWMAISPEKIQFQSTIKIPRNGITRWRYPR
jgi:hypothetical protein